MINQPRFQVGMTLEQLEKDAILFTFQYFQGNATRAAQSLGLSDKTVRAKLEEYKKQEELENARRIQAKQKRADDLAKQRGTMSNPAPFNGLTRPEQIADQQRRVEEVTALSARNGEDGYATERRAQSEPLAKIPAQQPVPLSERKEVQGVLPGPVAQAGPVRRGR